MLTTTATNITTEELATLRDWIKSPGARLFRKIALSKVHESQIQATKELSTIRVRRAEDAELLLKKSDIWHGALAAIDEVSDLKTTPYTVRIIEEQ